MLRKINRKAKKRVFSLIFLFVFLVSSQFLIFSSPVSATIQEEDISVEWGDNVFQNLPYWYSGTFYDDADFTFAWTTAKIQFEYIPDSSVAYEHSITELDNSETQYPTNSSFSMVNGTHIQNGTLNAVDDDYHAFDSTYNKLIAEQPGDFTILNGSSDYTGDLELLDDDYTTFESEKLPESEHYPAIYTFTDDADGSPPADWDYVSGTGTYTVIASLDGHKKVYQMDDTAALQYKTEQIFTDGVQTSGTIEWWWRMDDVASQNEFKLYDGVINVIKVLVVGGDFKDALGVVKVAVADTWYHHRLDFDCDTDIYDWYIDGVLERNDGAFLAVGDSVSKIQSQTGGGAVMTAWYDAVAYSWEFSADDQYEAIGDNWYYNYYLGNQTFEQYNTSFYDFYGSYSFNEDPVGTTSTGIGFIDVDNSGAGCVPIIISDLGGHKKVLSLPDGSGVNPVDIENEFSNQDYGTIEFWTYITDATGHSTWQLKDGATILLALDINVDQWQYWDGAYHNVGLVPLDNTWHHVRIDYECTADGYMGLAQYDWQIYIDGASYGDYNFGNNQPHADGFGFNTPVPSAGYTTYMDAIGYDWLSNYTTGDNINVYGELQELRDEGWSFDFDFDVSARITGEDTSHRKILELYDNSGTYSVGANYSFPNQSTGTYEAYFKSDLSNKRVYIFIEDGTGSHAIKLRFGGAGQVQEDDGGGYADIQAYLANTWYHFRVEWDCADDWHLWIDDVSMDSGAGYDFFGTPTEMDKFHVYTEFTQNPINFRIDSLSFDWDVGYTIGDNQRVADILDLIIEVNINLDSFSNLNELYLVYAYLTNISLICNYSIYNFDDSDYDAIEYDINLAFVNSYFLLNSSYYNVTNDLILSFEMTHVDTEFEMRLDRLLVRKPSYLNFSTSVSFDVIAGLLQMDINSYQRSNISQLINMSIWNYDTSSWLNINSSSYITTFQLLQWISTDFSDYIDSNGIVSLSYYGVNITDAFRFELDALNVILWRKTIVQYEKILSLLGTWKYQFVLDVGLGTEHITDWIYFNVIEQSPNFEGISESRYSTQWVLTSTATSGEKNIIYNDVLTTGYWDLCDAATRSFNKYAPDHLNYLLDNSTSTSTIVYSGTHFDVGLQDGAPRGVCWDGTYFWVVGQGSTEVYKYNSVGVYQSVHFDVGAQDSAPFGITWDGTHFWVVGHDNSEVYKYNSAGVYQSVSFYVGVQEPNPRGITWDGTHFWVDGHSFADVFKYDSAGVYQSVHFDVGAQDLFPYGITWDGTHFWISGDISDEVYKYTSAGVYTGTHFDVGLQDNTPFGITWDGTYFWVVGNTNDEVYRYNPEYTIYKNYHTTTGEGYAYFQTHQTETLGIISEQFGDNETLIEGDIFVVDLQTTSDNALLKLYSGGVLQQTLNLLTGNTEFARQEVEVLVSVDVSFDQIKITSELTDTEYFKLYDIKAEHWVFEDEEDQRSMYVNPYGQNDLIANLGNNSLKIYENDILRIDIYVTISYDLLTHIFESTIPETVFVSFYDSNNEYLDFNKFSTYVNYTLYEEDYIDQRLTSREFYVDEESTIYFNVYDSFDVNIYSALRLAKTFIDITLDVYSLKIKNEALDDASYTLTKGIVSKEGILFPDDIDEYQIVSGNYTFSYIKGSDSEVSVSFDLTQNRLLKINRSQMCYLTYSNQRGEHLFFENYKTYINGSLIYENIFYRDIGDIVGIEIKDRYDISIKNETYTVVAGDNYIPITLTMHSLKVMNQQEIFNWINITRDPNYYESSMYWSEWIAPNEIIEFNLFAGYYKINLTDNENSGSSYYSYTLNGDDVLLISSGNTISNLIINIANVNTTIGNQITNVQIDLTNQNSNINNTIINIDINLSNVNSTLGNLLTNINLDIININNNISNLYTFTENNFLNLGNNINNSFISITNNIIAINQTISTLVIGLDGKITIVNATITTMFTEMNSQFIVVQSTLDFSFAFLNQTIVQIGNNITNNQIALNNLIIQRANDIDNSIIQIQTLINLLNSTVANESLVVQTLVNIIGSNITENHVIINNLINLLGNNITENNINLVSLIELVGNNITTNHFVIQTLIDYVSNNITDNHLEFLTNINLINNTIGQNQIELINRLLFINNSINQMALDLTNQIILVNNTIYSAILDVSVSIDFNSDNILGNISLTYQQNDFLTELYRKTMFSQLLNWSDVAYNYTLMEDRIDVWEFINLYKDDAGIVFLRYNDLIDNLTVSAQNTIDQYLPSEGVEYRVWSTKDQKYLDEWQPLPENKTVDFGFYETDVPIVPRPLEADFYTFMAFIIVICVVCVILVVSWSYIKSSKEEVPEDVRLRHRKKKRPIKNGVYDHR